MTPEEREQNLQGVIVGLKQKMAINGFLTKSMFVFPQEFNAILLGVPTPPQSFREQLKDSFRDNDWNW